MRMRHKEGRNFLVITAINRIAYILLPMLVVREDWIKNLLEIPNEESQAHSAVEERQER